MIHLTDSAANAVQTAMAGTIEPAEGLRIMVETGGCAGFKYMMGLVTEINPDDIVIEAGRIRLFVDTNSFPYLDGTTVDFVSNIEGAGFTFDNPNAGAKCSCGKSFN